MDLNVPDQSQRLFRIGRTAADEAEEPGLCTWLLVNQSIGPYFSRRSDQAVAVLTEAVDMAGGANARRRAWASAMLARAYASTETAERKSAALDALNRAAAFLSAAGPVEGGLDFFDEARLSGIAGSVFLRVRDTESAGSLLHEALRSRSREDVKGRALLMFDLAECHVIAGEIEEAASVSANALDLAAASLVRPIVGRAMEIHQVIRRWRNLTAVADFSERLRVASASIAS